MCPQYPKLVIYIESCKPQNNPMRLGPIIISFSQKGKQRHRDITSFVQGHRGVGHIRFESSLVSDSIILPLQSSASQIPLQNIAVLSISPQNPRFS